MLERLCAGVLAGDEKIVRETAQQAIEKNIDPIEVLEKGLIPGVAEVGAKFERMELYLADMMMSAEAMRAGMNVVLPKIPKDKIPKRGTVVLGTVKGDIHEMGKNILSALLIAAGFSVHDLGCDTPSSTFVSKAEEVDANIIGASALMTTTLTGQKDILDHLNSAGKRDKYSVLVGGAPTSADWARDIGADRYAELRCRELSLR